MQSLSGLLQTRSTTVDGERSAQLRRGAQSDANALSHFVICRQVAEQSTPKGSALRSANRKETATLPRTPRKPAAERGRERANAPTDASRRFPLLRSSARIRCSPRVSLANAEPSLRLLRSATSTVDMMRANDRAVVGGAVARVRCSAHSSACLSALRKVAWAPCGSALLTAAALSLAVVAASIACSACFASHLCAVLFVSP